MVKPKNPPRITAEDLAASGLSGVFFSILSDVKQFYDYNYRCVCVCVSVCVCVCARARVCLQCECMCVCVSAM